MEQFERLKSLIGQKSLEKLFNSKVIVFGVGGVGGYAIEALARSGIKEIHIVDNDVINLTNINRQIIALYSTVNKAKVDVMKDRILDINPKAIVKTYQIFFDEKTKSEFDFSQYDYIIDAIDSVKSKILLMECAKENNIPIISSMGTGNKLDPTKFQISDFSKTSVCPLARVIRNELKKRNIKEIKVLFSIEEPTKTGQRTPASNSFVPSVAGLIIAGEVIKDLSI